MAVDDFLSRETDAFVLPSRCYYPLKIPIAHYQLRHFISSPEPNLLFYASGCDVYCINASTRIQSLVVNLPWEARCTASGYGYVCVGGADEGNFAAIKVTGFPPAPSADVDALLPLDLPNRTTVPRPPLLAAARGQPNLTKIGEDIVNSISIHKFPADGDGQEDVVAILTNNDKSVRVYSLIREREVAVLHLPFPMNHATISPDGQLLVAVGDQHVGYFFERTKNKKPKYSKDTETQIQSEPPEWTLFQEVSLYVPPCSQVDGYFTTAWSPSGRLCAVGSESGYITVFDVDLLKRCDYGEDAIVQLLSSTRPDIGIGPGAVRTMQFSPAPWDFLIWSEDQARVCVADVRSGLKVKQVLSLDPNAEGTETVEIADFDVELPSEVHDLRREADFIRRYRRALDSEGTAAAVNFATDYIQASSERRRLHRRLGVVESDDDPHGLTAHERQVLEALRTTRQRDEARGQGDGSRNTSHTAVVAESRREREAAARRNMTETFTEFMSESARQLNQLQERTAASARQLGQLQERTAPRRQASIIVSLDAGSRGVDEDASNSTTHTNITGGATTRSPNPIPAHARRENDFIASTDDAWRTIEEALARNARVADSVRSSQGPELRSELRRLRQLTQMRERLRNAREGQGSLDSYGLGLGFRRASRTHDPAHGLRTAGLAMSQDGRTLYCGTEAGIFEFQINMHQRKAFPAITPR